MFKCKRSWGNFMKIIIYVKINLSRYMYMEQGKLAENERPPQ